MIYVTKQASFLEGVGVALAVSVFAAASEFLLTPWLGRTVATQALAPAIGFTYLVYLLSRSGKPVGRASSLVFWAVVTGIAWFTNLPVVLLVLTQAGIIWLIRSLYFYRGVLPALMDLGLVLLSLVTAFWALAHSGSVFLGIWTLFLLQALFVAIPRDITKNRDCISQDDHFQRAYLNAEAAVRKLAGVR